MAQNFGGVGTARKLAEKTLVVEKRVHYSVETSQLFGG